MKEKFPILYGQRITNTSEFINVQLAVMRDLATGKISVKEANAINRDSNKILKMFKGQVRQNFLPGRAAHSAKIALMRRP